MDIWGMYGYARNLLQTMELFSFSAAEKTLGAQG